VKHVHEESANEFMDVERHRLPAIGPFETIVLPAERAAGVVGANEPGAYSVERLCGVQYLVAHSALRLERTATHRRNWRFVASRGKRDDAFATAGTRHNPPKPMIVSKYSPLPIAEGDDSLSLSHCPSTLCPIL